MKELSSFHIRSGSVAYVCVIMLDRFNSEHRAGANTAKRLKTDIQHIFMVLWAWRSSGGGHIESVYGEKHSLELQPPPALSSQCGRSEAKLFQPLVG